MNGPITRRGALMAGAAGVALASKAVGQEPDLVTAGVAPEETPVLRIEVLLTDGQKLELTAESLKISFGSTRGSLTATPAGILPAIIPPRP